MSISPRIGFLGGIACVIAMLGLTLYPYGGNPSALIHYGSDLETENLPDNSVALTVPSYDGAHYFRIAEQLPIRDDVTGAYAYQRILLPVAAFILSFGQDAALPWIFLAVNVLCIIGTGYLAQKKYSAFTTLALMLCPAMMLGLHFSLTEPLTILLLTAFLLRWKHDRPIDLFGVILLSLVVLTREINVAFVLLLGAWLLPKKRWNDVALLCVPVGIFILWHAAIYGIFGELPFLMSADKRGWPLVAVWEVLLGIKGYNIYTLSSIALLLGFVAPTFAWSIRQVAKEKDVSLLTISTLAFTALMLCMPDHIWGSITSIGRVITPVYPCAILALSNRDSWAARAILSAIVALGLGAGIGLALIVHPFTLT